jgi:hypothetical protein
VLEKYFPAYLVGVISKNFISQRKPPFGIGIKPDFKAATSTLLGHSLAQALQLTHNSKRHTIPYD